MRALITGVSGQDGTILASMLASQGYSIVGMVKPGTQYSRLLRYVPSVEIVEVDLTDHAGIRSVISSFSPSHTWNFGGFTAPGDSWDHSEEVFSVNVDSVRVMLESLQSVTDSPRFFQASSASIFEGVDRAPQTESMQPEPKSPYAVSKLEAMQLVAAARRDLGLFGVSGIFYNHESPLRGVGFVTRKVSQAAARISAGLQDRLELGDIEVARDWGWAPDYVQASILMLNAEIPKDYVLATGISHRLSFFVAKAFAAVGISNWQDYVFSTSENTRSVDTNLMVGDSRAAYLDLGWRHTVDFDSMAAIMVAHDVAQLANPRATWEI